MKKEVGLWIDNQRAVIFGLTGDGAELKRIPSPVNNPSPAPNVPAQELSSELDAERSAFHLNKFFDEVLAHIRDAQSIWIFGPGDAKIELRKRLENLKLHGRIVGFDTVDAMTDNQVVTRVRRRFLR
jgi:hypothetical protein